VKKVALLFGSCLAADLAIHLVLNTGVMTERTYLLAWGADLPEASPETLSDALRAWNRLSYASLPILLLIHVGAAALVVQLGLIGLGVRWRLEAIVVAALWAQIPLSIERGVRTLWLSLLPPPERLSATTGFVAAPWSMSSLLRGVAYSRRQPRRDRHPCLPCLHGARQADRRDLQRRGLARAPPVQGGRGLPDSHGQGTGRGLPRHRGDHRARRRSPGRRDPSGVRLPGREPDLRPPMRRGGDRLHRAVPRAPRALRGQAPCPGPGHASGVPVVPGTKEPVEDLEDAVAFAREAGYPVIVKAAAGGGGRGMRTAADEEELRRSSRSLSGKPPRPSVGAPSTWSASSATPSAHRGADPGRRHGASCTSGSGTARSSDGTRRSWRSPPPSASPPRCALRDLRGRDEPARGHGIRGCGNGGVPLDDAGGSTSSR
jgi:hypothetical protein